LLLPNANTSIAGLLAIETSQKQTISLLDVANMFKYWKV
jgi:hypothetical protein